VRKVLEIAVRLLESQQSTLEEPFLERRVGRVGWVSGLAFEVLL